MINKNDLVSNLRLEKERLALIVSNDQAREPVGYLDKDEVKYNF